MVVCPKCGNCDKKYFGNKNGTVYCRKCLTFTGKCADKEYKVKEGNYKLDYSLTFYQKNASKFILDNVKKGKNCALNAVCGAGKTEIIYETIEYCLKNNKRIGIAIPRKDVVIELKERINKDFNVAVSAVYGGNTDVLESDIIIFTTHQAFRFINYFDILIVDEVDAFPYNNNEVLKNIISKCSKTFVYLSATMPLYIEEDKKIAKHYLNKRYHCLPIPIPTCKICFSFIICLKKLLKKYKDKVVLVYFPTIKDQVKISKKIKHNYLINSKSKNREELLDKIKNMNKGVILTTTVLERGITIKDAQVIVYNAEHKSFNKDTLIQIAGRVGRKKECYKGDVIFLCKEKNKNIKRAIKTIKKNNE